MLFCNKLQEIHERYACVRARVSCKTIDTYQAYLVFLPHDLRVSYLFAVDREPYSLSTLLD